MTPEGRRARKGALGWRRLLRILAPHKGRIFLAAALGAAYAALDAFSFVLLIPLLAAIFGEGAPPKALGSVSALLEVAGARLGDLSDDPERAIGGIILLMLLALSLKNAADFWRSALLAGVEERSVREIQRRLYRRLLAMDLRFFARKRTGQLISRFTTDAERLRSLMTRELFGAVSQVFVVAASLYWMVRISPRLALIALVIVPLVGLAWAPLVRRLRREDRGLLELSGMLASQAEETVAGIRQVKDASGERELGARFRALTHQCAQAFMRAHRLRALAPPATELFVAAGVSLILWIGARMVAVDGSLEAPAFIGFVVLSSRLYAPIKHLGKLPGALQPGLAALDRIFEILDEEPGIRSRKGARPFAGAENGICFRRVRYVADSGEEVLAGIDFEVAPGSVAAFVGPSGSGKTTIMDLCARYLDPESGSVEVNGVDLRDYDLRSLREAVAVASQETILLHDTIRGNIVFGLREGERQRASPANVLAAARAAGVDEFAERLPEGYETQVGARGSRLSGGQRQRVQIARALLRDPSILILDEATGALDAESEERILTRICANRERTTLIVSHRASAARRADMVFVIREGRVVQRGSPLELAEEGGFYRDMLQKGSGEA